MSTSFLSWTPPIWFDAWVPRNTSCPPSRPDTKVDDIGVERSSSEVMSMLMNGRRVEPADSPASDPFHPDPVDHRFLPADSNAYQHHFDIPFFKYLTPIHDDFKAAHGHKVSCRDQVLEAVIVDTASSLVTAEAVRFALQSSLADGQYVHQHLGRLQEEGSRTDMLEVIDRYALGPGVHDVSAIIVVRRVSIADMPWWRVDTRTVSSTTAWPLVLVRRKPIDGLLVDMTCSPSKSPIGPICGARTLGNRRSFGISIRPTHKHWDLDNFERLPENMSSYSSTSAPCKGTSERGSEGASE